MTASTEMPQYVCHKRVWALKIKALVFHPDGSATIRVADEGYAEILTKIGYQSRFNGGVQPLDYLNMDWGYYVQYADGFESWSPTKAFEEGYKRVDGGL